MHTVFYFHIFLALCLAVEARDNIRNFPCAQFCTWGDISPPGAGETGQPAAAGETGQPARSRRDASTCCPEQARRANPLLQTRRVNPSELGETGQHARSRLDRRAPYFYKKKTLSPLSNFPAGSQPSQDLIQTHLNTWPLYNNIHQNTGILSIICNNV